MPSTGIRIHRSSYRASSFQPQSTKSTERAGCQSIFSPSSTSVLFPITRVASTCGWNISLAVPLQSCLLRRIHTILLPVPGTGPRPSGCQMLHSILMPRCSLAWPGSLHNLMSFPCHRINKTLAGLDFTPVLMPRHSETRPNH